MWDTIKGLLTSDRVKQLAARWIEKGLLVLATYLHVTPAAEGYSNLSMEVAALIIAGVMFIADHYLHAKQASEESAT